MTVFTICYNEEVMLPHFIKHYRKMFPDCRIVIYDNMSTDDTALIALANKCEMVPYDTNGKLNDLVYLEIKNNCWKEADGWVIVADCDEFCDIKERDLNTDATVIRFEGYNMVNLNDDMNFDNITHAIRSESYDKLYCFNASQIEEINYSAGCHHANPIGNIVYSNSKYVARHYKYFNPDYMVKRHAMFSQRLSDENKRKGYGGHYQYSKEQIMEEWKYARANSKRLI